MSKYLADVRSITSCLKEIPRVWEGKKSVLELRDIDFQWKQMEWLGFYFEYKAKQVLGSQLIIPGDKFGNVIFDIKGWINWDLKARAIKSDSHTVILNDKEAMDHSIKEEGAHGEIIALCDVEYNDEDRSFQKWHTQLKGGKSKYEVAREARTSVSRYRKTRAELTEVLLLILKKKDADRLPTMRQGRNSDGSPRKLKYMVDLDQIKDIEQYRVTF